MAKDHFLPASLIGRFSDEANIGSARTRKVYVARKGKKPYKVKAANIGYVNDLYRVSGLPWDSNATTIDSELHGYESQLPAVLDILENSAELSLEIWLRVAVPFVAGLFIRGNDFIARFMDRLTRRSIDDEFNTVENANLARMIGYQRLLAPVCCAHWIVQHKVDGASFTLNDIGLTGTIDASSGHTGWVLPIGKNSALGIFPSTKRTIARYAGGEWKAVIQHNRLNPAELTGFNDSIADFANSFVIGPELDELERITPIIGRHDRQRDKVNILMDAWPISREAQISHMHEWHRLLVATMGNPAPGDMRDLQHMDASGPPVTGWVPPISYIVGEPDFPTGLKLVGNNIRLDLSVPPGYSKLLAGTP